MAYDTALAAKVRAMLSHLPQVTERTMFGGHGFMVNGHLTVAVGEGDIMVRLDKEESKRAALEPGATISVMNGRQMVGWVDVGGAAIGSDEALRQWVERAVTFVLTLPPKT